MTRQTTLVAYYSCNTTRMTRYVSFVYVVDFDIVFCIWIYLPFTNGRKDEDWKNEWIKRTTREKNIIKSFVFLFNELKKYSEMLTQHTQCNTYSFVHCSLLKLHISNNCPASIVSKVSTVSHWCWSQHRAR